MKKIEDIAKMTSITDTNIALMMVDILFSPAELMDEGCNVSGFVKPGCKPKRLLGELRTETIKRLITERLPLDQRTECWKNCINAIHKRQFFLRKKKSITF
jgi:hypothetical protein